MVSKGFTMNDTTKTVLLDHSMERISLYTRVPFADFRARFEGAVPPFDEQRVLDLVARDASWEEVLQALRDNAPHNFVIFGSVDVAPLMALAGHRSQAVEYLMGNHTIAERMFRYDPHTLLYAPLRILLFEDTDGTAIFSLDRPSSAFASLGRPEIDEVGVELDRKVAALLEVLGVTAPDALTKSDAVRAVVRHPTI